MAADAVATPVLDVSGVGRFSPASLLLSSRRLLLLARSRRLFPDDGAWGATLAAGLPPFELIGRNQRHTSSVSPSVSKTNLAGTPSLLQLTHAIY